MPVVPTLAPDRVPGMVPQPSQRVDANPAAFGALQGNAMEIAANQIGAAGQRLAGAIGQGGDVLANDAIRQQMLTNKIATDGAFNQLQDFGTKLAYGDPGNPAAAPGYLTLRGRDALDGQAQALKTLEDQRTAIKSSLQNPMQALEFEQQSRRYASFLTERMAAHAVQQQTVTALATAQAGENIKMTAIGAAPFDEEGFQHNLADLQTKVREKGALAGASPEMVQDDITKATQKAYDQRALAMGTSNPAAAMKFLEDNKDKFTPGMALQLKSHFQAKSDQDWSNGAAWNVAAGDVKPRGTTPQEQQRAQAVHDGLVKRGMDSDAAWGMAANALHESMGDPNTPAGDMGASHGLFMWRGDRLDRFKATHGGKLPEQTDLDTQLDYAVSELNGPEAAANSSIQLANGPAAKAAVISAAYLRPKDVAAEQTRRASTAAYISGGSPVQGGRDAALQTALDNAPNENAANMLLAKTQRMWALQDKAAKDAQEAAGNKYVTQILKDPLQVNPDDISNDKDLTWQQKAHIAGMRQSALAGAMDDKDTKTYGAQFWQLYSRVHAPEGDPNRITDPGELYQKAGPGGGLTVSGVDKLTAEINGRKTPEGEAEGEMKKQFFTNARGQISGSNEGLHMKDPKGDELYLKFMAQALPAYDAGKKAGKSAAQLLNPDSPDYIGKSIAQFKRPLSQWTSDMLQGSLESPTLPAAAKDTGTAPDLTTPDGLKQAVAGGKIGRQQAIDLAVKRGWIRASAPAAPSAPVN